MTPEEQSGLYFRLSPWLVGTCLELVLQGVIFCQLSRYLGRSREDHLYIKLAVTGLAILTTLKSIQSFALVWVNFVEDFMDITTALKLNWLKTYNPLMVSFIDVYVQVYLCYRLWIVSGLWWVVAIIATLMLFGFISIILATYFIATGTESKVGAWFAAHLSSVMAGDLLLSIAMIFFLLKNKRAVVSRTAGVLSALVRLTILSALPAAICATLNLLFSQLYPGTEKLISTSFNQMLPKLYAISMLYTLNARQGIRQQLSATTAVPGTGVEVIFAKHGGVSANQGIEMGPFRATKEKDTGITEESGVRAVSVSLGLFTQRSSRVPANLLEATRQTGISMCKSEN